MPKKSPKCPMLAIDKKAMRDVYVVVIDAHESIEDAINDYGVMSLADARKAYKNVVKATKDEVNWFDAGTTWGVAMAKISYEVVKEPVYFTSTGENL